MELPESDLDFSAVKKQYLLRIESGEFLFQLGLSNGGELKIHMGSISKPETKQLNEILELIKMNQFSIELKLNEKLWKIFQLDNAVYKKTFEQIKQKIVTPKTKFEVFKLKSESHLEKSKKDSKEHKVIFKPRSDILELTNIQVAVPYDVEYFLDSFVPILRSLNVPPDESPKKKVEKPAQSIQNQKPKKLFDLSNSKYIISVKGFKFMMEDNPLEVAFSYSD
jgi:hypothetical protein